MISVIFSLVCSASAFMVLVHLTIMKMPAITMRSNANLIVFRIKFIILNMVFLFYFGVRVFGNGFCVDREILPLEFDTCMPTLTIKHEFQAERTFGRLFS